MFVAYRTNAIISNVYSQILFESTSEKHVNSRQLEAFRATLRRGSITGAAKLLHISQPSVSRLIADLEESLGFKLFTRTGHGLVSTVEARRFQQTVESMFVGLDKLRDTAEAIRTTRDETVALGVIPIFAFAAIPEAIASVHAERLGDRRRRAVAADRPRRDLPDTALRGYTYPV